MSILVKGEGCLGGYLAVGAELCAVDGKAWREKVGKRSFLDKTHAMNVLTGRRALSSRFDAHQMKMAPGTL